MALSKSKLIQEVKPDHYYVQKDADGNYIIIDNPTGKECIEVPVIAGGC